MHKCGTVCHNIYGVSAKFWPKILKLLKMMELLCEVKGGTSAVYMEGKMETVYSHQHILAPSIRALCGQRECDMMANSYCTWKTWTWTKRSCLPHS